MEYIETGFFRHHLEVFLEFRSVLWESTLETLYMTFATVTMAYAIGLPLGMFLVCLGKGGLFPNRAVHAPLSFVINTTRSIPFLILLVALIPFSRLIVGSGIGNNAAIVALVVAAAPFIARMVETALNEVDVGVVDAAKSMGANNFQIMFKVLLPESIPSLIRGFSITTINIMSFSAMAGVIGAGGLGRLAIRYGINFWRYDIMLIIIIVIVIIVTIIQFLFNLLATKIDRRI
ncbi:MAG: ABC transporter permease [Clostridiales bacterium]|jgi:D-methionine transport system permease protein|nr:ABC transporter permease [Clostridiales bacterium]